MKFLGVVFFILSIKLIFFLPPPQIKILQGLPLTPDKKFKSSIPIILAVNSVRVAAPSSKSRPLTNPTLKSFMSNDEVNVEEITLDKEVNNDHFLHYVIKARTWFYMKSQGEYSLIGCTVSPPFDYKDFELAAPEWNPKNFNQDL